jgi:NAD(P)-dependent dehydrogenase (short-subunit alcohol dehydrogenase family)
MVMQTLKNRTCVFAGATGGDGVAAVEALLRGGMNVIMVTHQAAQAQELLDRMNELGLPGCCEVIGAGENGPAENQADTYAYIQKKYGSVDVVISNTGSLGKKDSPENVTSQELMESIGHLVSGGFDMVMAALPFLKQSKAPRVILMTSVEGRRGGTMESFSNAVAKGAVLSLSLNLAARFAEYGICVNCISKGAIPRKEGVLPGMADPYIMLPYIPLKRMGTPEDLAETICYFASEESAYVTGQVLSVSGGMEMN